MMAVCHDDSCMSPGDVCRRHRNSCMWPGDSCMKSC